MKTFLTLLTCSGLVVTGANAAIYTLYTGAADLGTITNVSSNGTDAIVENVAASGFGSGDALRVADLGGNKPEASWSSTAFGGSDLTEAFVFQVTALNLIGTAVNDYDINLRMSDAIEDSLGSKGDQLISISFEETNSVKLDGSTISGSDTSSAQTFSFLINPSDTISYTYTFGDQVGATLSADTTLAFIDGVLAGSKTNPSSIFNHSSGIHRIGFVGESNSKSGMDYLFDDVSIMTGADAGIAAIPEPSTIGFFLGAFVLGLVARRRR